MNDKMGTLCQCLSFAVRRSLFFCSSLLLTFLNRRGPYFGVINLQTMKKLFLLATLFVALFTTASAQERSGANNQEMRQKMRETMKAQLVEKTKITAEQADKVLDINMEAGRQRRELRNENLSDDERAKKTAAIDEESAKKFKAIPLTDDQVKSIQAFMEEARKNRSNGPRGGNR